MPMEYHYLGVGNITHWIGVLQSLTNFLILYFILREKSFHNITYLQSRHINIIKYKVVEAF